MAEKRDKSVGDADAAGQAGHVSAEDRRVCGKCGYALCGLDLRGVCPECGIAVSPSLVMRMLADASKETLSQVLCGINLLVVGLGMGLVLVPLAAMLRVGEEWRAAVEPWQEIGFSTCWLGWAMLMWEGSRRYAAVDAPNERAMGPAPGRYMMVGAMTGAVGSGLNWLGIGVVRTVPEISHGLLIGALAGMIVLGVIGIVIVLTGPICWSVWFFNILMHTRSMGRRIPDSKVVVWTARMMWLVPLAIVGSGLLTRLANVVFFGGVFSIFELWVVVTVVCVDGSLVWMMLTLLRVRAGVRAVMKVKERSASEGGGIGDRLSV